MLDAVAASQTLLALLTLLFTPDPPGLQLLPLRPSVGAYLMRWGRRLILIAVPGYTIGEVALLLGLSPPAHAALQKSGGPGADRLPGHHRRAAAAVGAAVAQRAARGHRRAGPVCVTAWRATGIGSRCSFWPPTWLAWTLRAPDAIARDPVVFRRDRAVILIAAIARTAILAAARTARAGSEASEADRRGDPVNPSRDPADASTIRRSGSSRRWSINVLALLALLQLYGLGGLSWLLTSEVGRRVVSGVRARWP